MLKGAEWVNDPWILYLVNPLFTTSNSSSPFRGGYFLKILPEIRFRLLPVFPPLGFEEPFQFLHEAFPSG